MDRRDSMKAGIICAGDREFAPFLPHIENDHTTEKAMLAFHEGNINGMPIVALYCGVCKVNAAIAAQILIDSFQVTAVINAGTAGGMDKDVKLFNTVIAEEVAYHDVADFLTEFHPWMDSVYFSTDEQLLGIAREICKGDPTVRFGRMVTGEQFITDDGRAEINEKFTPLSVDMETASIAHVCYVNQIPFIAIRCITDTADHAGTGQFQLNCPKASAIAKDFTLAMLHKLKGCDSPDET